MNNHENHTSSTNQFVIDINPFNSVAMKAMVTGENPHEVVNEYITRLTKDVHFNILDMPFIVMALDVMHKSLETHMDEKDRKLYELLKAHSDVITMHVDGTKDHSDSEGENDDGRE